MQRTGLYIGFPIQQVKVLGTMLAAVSEKKSGIHLVTGGIRSGKSSIINAISQQNQLQYPLPMYTNDYDQVLEEYKWLRQKEAKNGSHVLFVTTEIPDTNSDSLRALQDIVSKELEEGNNIRVFGDVVTKRFPAWNSKGNNQHVANILKDVFDQRLLHLYPLDSNPISLAEGVWEIIHTEQPAVWSDTAEELGLPPSYSLFWEQLPESKEDFTKILSEIMIKNPLGNLEGHYKGGPEF